MKHHLKKDQRGVSNIIVVVLSLIIIVVIVANVILWSYQMNQLDWEKMQESVSIENVTQGTLASYNPSGYMLIGSTKWVSGSISNLASNDGVYMVFRSYASATSAQTLFAHQETTTIGASTYYWLKLNSSNAVGTTLSVSAKNARNLLGKFVYSLQGVSSISASTWTFYYRAYSSDTLSHIDVDIIIRKSDDTIRTSWVHVANSSALGTSYSTVSATYTWASYIVVNQTDYLEIDYYHHNTATTGTPRTAYLRIDDSTLAIADQTRVTGVMFPSEYTMEVEFAGTSNTETWTRLVWAIDSAWTTGNVSVRLQLYNYTLGAYPTSGNGYISYISSSTPDTDETKNQTITVNTAHFRDASGNWKIRVRGVKSTSVLFDSNVDWVEVKPAIDEARFTFKNKGASTSHIVSLWIINSTYHQRYGVDIFLNSGQTLSYPRADIRLPNGQYVVKIVTDRGNAAVYS